MKTTKLLPTAFLVTALLGAGAAVATAQNTAPTDAEITTTEQAAPEQARGEERPGFMERMRGDRDGERGGKGHGERGGKGGRHGGGMMLQQIMTEVDTDGDGTLTRAEIDAFRTAQVGNVDTDGNGALTIEEFETLHNDFMRERMVDAFQALDADGDGEISTEEFDTRVDRLVNRMDRNDDGAISPEDRRR